jgi:6-pyruvoyl-tetrahydropterin synthase
VQYSVRVRVVFGAAHSVDIEGHEPCTSIKHGHVFRVTASLSTRFDAKLGSAYEIGEFEAALQEITEELSGRDLNVMLPASLPTLDGIATWFLERLSSTWPRCYEIEVYEDPSRRSVTVTRELRGINKL